jgi:hypothetical protein
MSDVLIHAYIIQYLNQIKHIYRLIYHFFMVKTFKIFSSAFLKYVEHNYYL